MKLPNLFLKDEPSPMQNREARNQKQFNWDSLRNFGKGVGGFLEDSVNEVNDAVEDADDRVGDLEDRYDDQIAGATDLDEVIDARKPKNVNGYKTLGERLDKEYNELPFTETDTEVKEVFKQPLARLGSKINQKNFNMAFWTDAHFQREVKGYPYGYLSMNHLNNVLAVQDKVDVIVAGGDNNNSYSLGVDLVKHNLTEISERFLFKGTSADRFLLLGNHDNGDFRSYSGRLNRPLHIEDIASEDYLKEAYHTGDRLFDEVRNGDSLYFYKDYPDKKIRVIGINTMDIDDTLTKEDGSLKYIRLHDFAVRQEQLQWLAEVALANVPEDYHTMVVTHAHATLDSNGSGDSIETHRNFGLMMNLLEAFKQGNNVTLNGIEEDFKVNVTANFSKQGARNFIGYFNGHVHDERISVYTQFGSTYTCCCLLNSIDYKIDERPLDTPEEDAWTVISVDTINRKVNLIGFGAATDREFTY
ncbi:metallophosphoesterase family protein [Dellaglioa sp. L3N]